MNHIGLRKIGRKKMGLKDKRTLVRHLDRLQLFGYITWENRGKNKTNKYYIRGDDNFQSILNNNLAFA